jgi:hypothetical protein
VAGARVAGESVQGGRHNRSYSTGNVAFSGTSWSPTTSPPRRAREASLGVVGETEEVTDSTLVPSVGTPPPGSIFRSASEV